MKNCIISGFLGALCMFILIVSLALWHTEPQAAETEKYQHVDFISSIDAKDCFVCGEHDNLSTAFYWGKDNIGILNLNSFDTMYIEINRYDDNGEQILEPAGVMVSDRMKCGGSWVNSMTDPDRGYAHIELTNCVKEIQSKNVESRLCQTCLDEINSMYILDGKTSDYAVISFMERKIRPIYESLRWCTLGSFGICTNLKDDSAYLIVNYCPVRFG